MCLSGILFRRSRQEEDYGETHFNFDGWFKSCAFLNFVLDLHGSCMDKSGVCSIHTKAHGR